MIYKKIIQVGDFKARADQLSTDDITKIFGNEFSTTFFICKQTDTCRYAGRDDLWIASFRCLKFLGVSAQGIAMGRATGAGYSMHEAIRRCFMRYLFLCDQIPKNHSSIDEF